MHNLGQKSITVANISQTEIGSILFTTTYNKGTTDIIPEHNATYVPDEERTSNFTVNDTPYKDNDTQLRPSYITSAINYDAAYLDVVQPPSPLSAIHRDSVIYIYVNIDDAPMTNIRRWK